MPPPQVVEVLIYLIEHRDRIVPRQELLERFWPRAGTGGVSVRQTPRQTVVVLTLVDKRDGRLLWSGEFTGDTDMDDYVPLQRSLAERMAAGLTEALENRRS